MIINCSNLRPLWNGCIMFTLFVLKKCKKQNKTKTPKVPRAKNTCSGTSLAFIGWWICQSCNDVMWALCLRKRKKETASSPEYIKHLDIIEKFNVTGVNINAFQRPESKGTLLFRPFLNSLVAKFGQKKRNVAKNQLMLSAVFSARLNFFPCCLLFL